MRFLILVACITSILAFARGKLTSIRYDICKSFRICLIRWSCDKGLFSWSLGLDWFPCAKACTSYLYKGPEWYYGKVANWSHICGCDMTECSELNFDPVAELLSCKPNTSKDCKESIQALSQAWQKFPDKNDTMCFKCYKEQHDLRDDCHSQTWPSFYLQLMAIIADFVYAIVDFEIEWSIVFTSSDTKRVTEIEITLKL